MPACKHGGWDYCSLCMAEADAEQRGRDSAEAENARLRERWAAVRTWAEHGYWSDDRDLIAQRQPLLDMLIALGDEHD